MAKTGLTVADMDLIEANEAFAAQSLAVARDLAFDMEKVNVNGGAIAIGHPMEATGLRLIITLMRELKRRGGGTGVACLCGGLAQGDGVMIEV